MDPRLMELCCVGHENLRHIERTTGSVYGFDYLSLDEKKIKPTMNGLLNYHIYVFI